jgi:enoyl-CoA hydratase
MSQDVLIVDDPMPLVRRLTLNRPAKRNALSDELRLALFESLRAADSSPEVAVIIVRGAGDCFSAGYDLDKWVRPVERHAAPVDGWWPRHVVAGWFEMWDFATPTVAQVHGWCLAGGSELAAACDIVYIADDAKVGYPPVRSMSTPDMVWQPWLLGMRRGMEALLTGDWISGTEAAQLGFATRSFPADELEEAVLGIAGRVSKVPADILAINKRACHRSMEAAGIRTGMRACTELNAVGFHQRSSRDFMKSMRSNGVRDSLSNRDSKFADYREQGETSSAAERDA